MSFFRVVDIETTGLDPQNDAIVEIGCIDVEDGVISDKPKMALVKPPISIRPESSAVHHIVDADVTGAPQARDVVPALLAADDLIYVAHNSGFESKFLAPFIPGAAWLCTYRAALRVWPQAPNHKNQTLRYWLNLSVDRDIADKSHRALPDAYVTAHILCELLKKASVDDMLAWTNEPPLMPTCPIGEHRGKTWFDVPQDFLQWMVNKPVDDPDLVWNAQHELERREEAAKDGYVTLFKFGLKTNTQSVDEIRAFLKRESQEQFARYKIEKDGLHYKEIVAACTARRLELEEKARPKPANENHESSSELASRAALERMAA